MTTPPLIDVTGARRRRARERLRRRLTIAGVVAGIVAVIAGGVWLVGWSPVFVAEEVVVEGVSSLSADDVVDAAQVPLGSPLAQVDTAAVAERVRTLPAVEDVAVTAQPFHTVLIVVTERTAVLFLASKDTYTWVDAEGVAFATNDEPPAGSVQAEANVDDAELLVALAKVTVALPAAVREQVELVTADTPDSLSLKLSDGRQVIWGSADDSAFKAEVLVPLLTVDAEVYDVSAPTHPTTR